MPQIREQIAMVHLPPSKTLKYLFHVRKTTQYYIYLMIGFTSLTMWHLRTTRNGAAVIVCAIIGLSSLPKKEPGTAIRNVPRSTEQKPLTLFRPGVCKATWLIVMVKWSDGAIQMKRKPMIM